jgi:alpha-L-rhamnosidase
MSQQTLKIARLQVEHLRDATGIGTAQPRLTWTVETTIPNWQQTAYAIEATTPDGKSFGRTGPVKSAESLLVAWPFPALTSRQRVSVRVRTWGEDGSAADWCAPIPVEAGLLEAADWTARFIRPAWDEDTSKTNPAPLLRRKFDLRADVKQARLYITALGVYEAEINGTRVGDQVLAPGWTSYHHRLRYQTFDVTGLLKKGPNAIGAIVADGWFRGRMGFGGGRINIYGDRTALLAQLEVEYTDGTTEHIVTDDSWKASTGPFLLTSIYDGETYNAGLECPGWSSAGFDDSRWQGVAAVEWDLNTLVAPAGPPVRRTELVMPVSITTSPTGRTVVDFGQNLVGRLRITVRGDAGQTITLRHSEVLQNGDIYTRPLRYALATDRFVLKGSGVEVYEPRFTFHGFRYADVEGLSEPLKTDDIRAVVCHSDMERTGWFECSNPLINRLHENTVWSMCGNFFDIPTDCPQRDERLGWTGDIEVFSPTASFLFDSAGFLTSWLADVAAEQKEYGTVPFVVPSPMEGPTPPAAAWGDAATVIPWVIYQRFGDKKILADQFESMRAWVDQLDKIAGPSHLWDKGFQFGDWLDPDAPPDRPAKAKTPPFVIATGYFARSAALVALAAKVLGREEEVEQYGALANAVREAFNREYVTAAGRLLSDSSTAYALALQFALLPGEEQRQAAGRRLAALVRTSGYRISTGFVGTPLICDALCSEGMYTAAYRLLTQRGCPSWLYPVTMGATTIWERWDSMLPDGTVNPGEMTSFNHYALGAVADWMHRTVAGLAPAAPGYRKLEMHPVPGGGLTYANARHITPYGMASCAWRIEANTLSLDVVVPPSTTAEVIIPGGETVEVGSGAHSWTVPYQFAGARSGPLTLDSTIDELIDDPEAYEAVLKVVNQFGSEFAEIMLSQEGMTLRAALGINPRSAQMIPEVEAALANL